MSGGQWLTALALEEAHGELLAVLCVMQSPEDAEPPSARYARSVLLRLKPCLECLQRELANAPSEGSKLHTLTERTAELEWLFQVTSRLNGATGDHNVAEELLAAATERLHSALGVLYIPEKNLCLDAAPGARAQELRGAWEQIRPHLTTWTQRQRRPLVINTAGRAAAKFAPCKVLAVPIVRESGRVIGLMAFLNPPQAANYGNRQAFLARHLGRHTAGIVESQFDLMTGLYTRDGLQRNYTRLTEDHPGSADGSALYLDIDHLRVVNELHGFELGNELIVRVAELLAPPFLPAEAFAGRIAGDRFVVVLPGLDPQATQQVAQQLQAAAARLSIGPAHNPIEVSLSCGVAALVDMPDGLARAVAAAEIACKTAKNRGVNRIELYACEESSILRHQGDAIAVGQLRSALKHDGLLLYAQPIVALQDRALAGGYEILLRLRGADGDFLASGPLISAAQQYQLLPSVDRWVATRALQLLAPYRSMLTSRGISLSINVSGQSIGDETFIAMLAEQLRAAALPAGSITIEITEQAAVTNLARAHDMIKRLTALGCRIALDDFGTGTNSLTNLKTLQISRVKIDGSFVRDIATDRRSQATVRGIVELAKGLSMDTVAEYVENDAIAAVVRRMGVDYAQGYAFGKPQPLDALLAELAHDESRRMKRLMLELQGAPAGVGRRGATTLAGRHGRAVGRRRDLDG
ncbi:MAG TPA: bifunctional diguanylate cyclase/phosphodiesterase, partial [Candidatus Dormibacteraeota bacterium]|nr:bifunctional diguanylate cyclase/phosphodiesterase [Candidatus Dormibacteraeota bacterium]